MYKHYIILGIALVLIIATALKQGAWTYRWSDKASEIKELAEDYEKIPLAIERWEGKSQDEKQKEHLRTVQRAGAERIRTIEYTNIITDQRVVVMLVCGISRDVSTHPPDACYVAAGYEMNSKPEKYQIEDADNQKSEFFTAIFRKRNQNLRIFWAWTQDGHWEAPGRDPRVTYGGHRALNKMYLITNEPLGGQAKDSPCIEFARLFIPKFKGAVYPPKPDDQSKG